MNNLDFINDDICYYVYNTNGKNIIINLEDNISNIDFDYSNNRSLITLKNGISINVKKTHAFLIGCKFLNFNYHTLNDILNIDIKIKLIIGSIIKYFTIKEFMDILLLPIFEKKSLFKKIRYYYNLVDSDNSNISVNFTPIETIQFMMVKPLVKGILFNDNTHNYKLELHLINNLKTDKEIIDLTEYIKLLDLNTYKIKHLKNIFNSNLNEYLYLEQDVLKKIFNILGY